MMTYKGCSCARIPAGFCFNTSCAEITVSPLYLTRRAHSSMEINEKQYAFPAQSDVAI